MKVRVDNIIYQLAGSDDPLTADELGKKLAVSSRTIKSEMAEVKSELKKVGAELQAKRNEGYSLVIVNKQVFDDFYAQLVLRSSIMNNYYALDGQARFLYITRKLVSSSKYVRIEDLADEMFISRSALQKSLTEAMIFLKSFHLEWENRKGLGIRCYGKEYHVRIAMTELFAVHFHKAVLNDAGMEYSKWLECDFEERQKIRHTFLKILRESELRTSDINAQKLSIYLLIVRNRCNAGYRLWLGKRSMDEVRLTKEYEIAKRIFDHLSEIFEGYDLMEEETVFFAIYLLTLEDVSYRLCLEQQEPEKRFPLQYKKAAGYGDALPEHIKERLHIDFSVNEKVEYMLMAGMIPILGQFRYDLNGFKNFWYYDENYAMRSPVALKVARVMASYIREKEKKEISSSILLKLVGIVYQMIAGQEYNIRRMKLLLVSSLGIDGNEINKMRLLSRYGQFIESFTFAELYEIRGMNETEYDAILLDMTNAAYNYDLPCSPLHVIPMQKEMDGVFNKILLEAYQISGLLPEKGKVQVYRDFAYENEKQFFQFISFRHCADADRQRRMQKILTEDEALMTHCIMASQAAVIIGEYGITETESVELYCLQHEGIWSNDKIRYILYVCVDWKNDLKRVKAVENAVYQLTNDEKNLKEFEKDKDSIMEKMVYQYMKNV